MKHLHKELALGLAVVLLSFSVLPVELLSDELKPYQLSGDLIVFGIPAAGNTLSADLSLVQPTGLSGEDVSFLWEREEISEDVVYVPVSMDETYVPTEADVGCRIRLTVTAAGDEVMGELTAGTEYIRPKDITFQSVWKDAGELATKGSTAEEADLETSKTGEAAEDFYEASEPIEAYETEIGVRAEEWLDEEASGMIDLSAGHENVSSDVIVYPLDEEVVIPSQDGNETGGPVGDSFGFTASAGELNVGSEGAGFAVNPDSISFGTLTEGYDINDITPVQVVVNNGSDTQLQFEKPWSDMGSVVVNMDVSSFSLDAGQVTVLPVLPAANLPAGTYNDNLMIAVTNADVPSKSIAVSFTVEGSEGGALMEIYSVSPVGNVANGTEKTAEALGLPSQVSIRTTVGDMNAGVTWDVAGASYDPAIAYEQTFTVNGVVTLPSNISNPNGVSTETTVQVTTSAATEHYTADPSRNVILGIDPNGYYDTETKLTIEAQGDGMDNANPVRGDERYLPISWEVLESRNFDSSSYRASFRIARAGTFPLKILFYLQSFNGTDWENILDQATQTPIQDVREIEFTISEAGAAAQPQTTDPNAGVAQATATPVPANTFAPDPLVDGTMVATSVSTGSNAPIQRLLTAMLASSLCIGAGIVARGKHHR